MKQYVSVFMLALRSVSKKLIIILTAMVAAECALFALAARKYLWMEDIIAEGRVSVAFYGALMALTVVLCTSLAGNARQTYTLQRLAVSGRAVFYIQVLANGLCYLLLWTVQLVAALLLIKIYLASQLASADHSLDFCEQSAFLAFYRSEFLHSLFPLEELTRWLRNLALICGLAVTCAYGSCQQQRGKTPWSPFILAVLTILCFELEMGSSYADWLLVALAIMSIVRIRLILPADGPFMDLSSIRAASEKSSAEPAPTPEELEVMR